MLDHDSRSERQYLGIHLVAELGVQMLQSSLPTVIFDTGFTDRQPEHLCEALPKDETSRVLVRQLLRSGTSVGANYRAACLAKSKPTFISKLGDVLEEADESGFWIELLVDAGKAPSQDAASLLGEAKELVAILVASINTAKQNSGPEE